MAGTRADSVPGPAVVVGPVPVSARVAGGVALAGAAVTLLTPAFPLATAGGRDLGGAANAFDWLPLLPLVLLVGAAGALAVTGRLPRLGLAALLPVGTAAAGWLLHAAWLRAAADRSSQDLPLGIGTSFRYQPAAGLTVRIVADGLLVLAAALAAVAWSGTVMEDDGGFDRWRPRFGAFGLTAGILAALAVGTAPWTSSVAGLSPPTLLERDGIDLLGGLLVAGAVAGWGVLSATLRPRLAVAGGYLSVAVVLLVEWAQAMLLVVRSPVLGAGAGPVLRLLLAGMFVALAVAVRPRLPRRASAPARPSRR